MARHCRKGSSRDQSLKDAVSGPTLSPTREQIQPAPSEPVACLLRRRLQPVRTTPLGNGQLRSDEGLQVIRSDPHGGDHPDVRQLAALAEPVDSRFGYAELLGDLADPQQP